MNIQDKLRNLPSVDKILLEPRVVALSERYPRTVVVQSVRDVVSSLRERIRSSGTDTTVSIDDIVQEVEDTVTHRSRPSLGPAVNATGIILHTGLGRAVLPEDARDAVMAVARGHSTLEIDRESGKRGSRIAHIEGLLTELTGAEAAAAVNNNAAAVFLAINALALGKEVIISRGQLVEIGGSFRVPDIITRAGCRLVEVGTTNRTRISDYESAITENTGLILRVHPSNFKIVGFTEEASLQELVALGRSHSIPVMDDLGSGALLDMSHYGLKEEPLVQDSVKVGCDLVTFSGDKLLGGPQAGLIVGKRSFVDMCRTNPLARALRLDKMTLAALESTLRLYLDPERAMSRIPTLKAITRSPEDIKAQANRLASRIRGVVDRRVKVGVAASYSQVGGGSLPGQTLPSWSVTLRSSGISADDLSRHFRLNSTPIFGRIESDLFMLDVRTVAPAEAAVIVECAKTLLRR